MSVAPQTTLDLESILCDKLDLKPKDVEGYFDFEEQDGKLIVAVHKWVWLERTMWTVVNNYARELGGAWDPTNRQWEIPKKETPQAKEASTQPEPPKETQKPVETEVSTKVEIGDEYDLKLSKEKLGALIPILTDAHGNIIDGFHRERIDPNWPKIKLEHITDPVQLTMARLASNMCRRNVPAEEKSKLLANIAELTGWTPKEIADNIGLPQRTVYRYLPSEFKGPEPEQLASARVALYSKTQDMRGPVHCENCSLQTFNPQTFEGHVLCPVCFNEALKNPEKFRGKAKKSFESQDITPTVPVEEIDTGLVFTCPECGYQATHIHVNPSGKHKMQEVKIL